MVPRRWALGLAFWPLWAFTFCAACSNKPGGPGTGSAAPTPADPLWASPKGPGPAPGTVSQPPSGSLEPIYIDADLAQTYATFVLRNLTPMEKSARWARYYDGRWVRWCGELMFFTHEGLQFRYFGSSESYDVELFVPEPQKTALRSQLTLGRFYNYVGRLVRFDESFRVLTLDQGTVLHPDEFGVPGVLLSYPEPVWRMGPPPRVVSR